VFVGLHDAVMKLSWMDNDELEEVATSLEHPEAAGNEDVDRETLRKIAAIVRSYKVEAA
jgi:hypothetical protein